MREEVGEALIAGRSSLLLAITIVSLIGLFGIAIPFCAFLCSCIHTVARITPPIAASFLIATSWWLPLGLAVVGTIVLVEKERRLSALKSRVVNSLVLALSLALGGFAIFCCLAPTYLTLSTIAMP